ncbi:glycoside hydrolase family 88 protein [candidate division KSB1 bacterium]|nr:glycoside hydrolase family 88 protein [candidate division KSB1 bacterium]
MKSKFIHIAIAAFILQCGLNISVVAQTLDSLVSHGLEFARLQLQNSVDEVKVASKFPRSTLSNGTWNTKDSGSWTSGFFPGCLWYMYEYTSDNRFKEWAENWTAGMENEKYDTGSHDVGFKIFCSFGNGYRNTQNPAYLDVILRAAQSLATRYNPVVGCIKSWNSGSRGQYPVIIDNMMNLELLLWASKQPGGEQNWYDMAVSHAKKTVKNHIREDGSTYHVVDYDPVTGDVLKRNTVQGYADESTWARGQAWGLYGFTMVYRETGDTLFLQTAKKVADYFIAHLPADVVPYWDFQAPNIPNEQKDASAAAIAASGLLELSTLVNPEDKNKYRDTACDLITALCSPAFLAEGTNNSGIILHGVGNRNSYSEVDVTLIYSDYYYLEALQRYLEIKPTFIAEYENEPELAGQIQLLQNYPNPFNPETTIRYTLSNDVFSSVNVYDISGRLVRVLYYGFQTRGEHRLVFDGRNIPSGIYVLVLQAGYDFKTIKLTLVR